MKAMKAAELTMEVPKTLARPAIPKDATVKWTHVDTRNIAEVWVETEYKTKTAPIQRVWKKQ